ncbi:transcriptional regulator [plant metagenome]|uniref:Transcriptional regulator n=1 Tax=plant metagenome TaxID=1297885 RepID=A0A484Q8P8_9ZZZZ
MPTTLFRRAAQADVAAIVALLGEDPISAARQAGVQVDPEAYVQAYQAIDADPNQLLAVAEEGGEIVGTLQLTFIPGLSRGGAWRGQIEAVHVSSARRGSGVGAAFLRWAIETCRARGCKLVQLTTDKRRVDAHRFYERLGFEGSHLGYKIKLD